jgi:hypothetical protein
VHGDNFFRILQIPFRQNVLFFIFNIFFRHISVLLCFFVLENSVRFCIYLFLLPSRFS